MRQHAVLDRDTPRGSWVTGFMPDTLAIHNQTPWYLYLRVGDTILASTTSYHLLVPPMSLLAIPTDSDRFSATLMPEGPATAGVHARVELLWTQNQPMPVSANLRADLPVSAAAESGTFNLLAGSGMANYWSTIMSDRLEHTINSIRLLVPGTTSPGQVIMEVIDTNSHIILRATSLATEQNLFWPVNWIIIPGWQLHVRASNSDTVARNAAVGIFRSSIAKLATLPGHIRP